MRRIWIADDDDLELQFIEELLVEEPELSAVPMAGATLVARLDEGAIPDALLVDEAIVQPSLRRWDDRYLLPALRLVDRIVLIASHGVVLPQDLRSELSGVQSLIRPLDYHVLVDALRWLDRYSDDVSWTVRHEPVAAPAGSSAVQEELAREESEYGRHWPARAYPGETEEERAWRKRGQWAPEYQ